VAPNNLPDEPPDKGWFFGDYSTINGGNVGLTGAGLFYVV